MLVNKYCYLCFTVPPSNLNGYVAQCLPTFYTPLERAPLKRPTQLTNDVRIFDDSYKYASFLLRILC